MSHLGRNRGSAAKRTVLRVLRGYSVGRPPEPLTERTACSTFGAMTIFARRNIAGAAAAAAALTAALLCPPAVPAQEHEAHRHGGERLGRVVFPISCAPAARPRFEHAMAVLHRSGGRAAIGPSARCWRPTRPAPWRWWGRDSTRGAIPSRAARRALALAAAPRLPTRAAALPARTARERGFIAAAARALPRRGDHLQQRPAPRLRRHDGAPVPRLPPRSRGRHLSRAVDGRHRFSHRYHLRPPAPRPSRFSTRCSPAIPTIPAWPTTSFTPPTHPGSPAWDCPRLGATRRIAPAAPHAQHMPSHIFIRLVTWTRPSAPTGRRTSRVLASRQRPASRALRRRSCTRWTTRSTALSSAVGPAARAVAAEGAGLITPTAGPWCVLQPDGDGGADPARARATGRPRRRSPYRPTRGSPSARHWPVHPRHRSRQRRSAGGRAPRSRGARLHRVLARGPE